MGVAGFITITFIILFGALFIHITNKINKMEINTRDRGAEIDSSLWDRTFRLSRICSLLNAKGIENELECPDVNALGLGVSAPIQAANAEKLDKQDILLRSIIKEHPELTSDEAFSTELEKFNNARNEMFRYSLSYNKSVNAYNSYISSFPASVIVIFNKKNDKQIFGYVFTELDSKVE